ncbi:hypothetical protein B0T10DRAFT_610361 [Thelonectria olida]|uniref:Uncharacterized protein n=1 Tax=Thelonectria olida TaxID=1576542 RepID=A0A9P8VTV6_9HYPO|nr:hypothetical protein B0T10DRAFT_610361 [Thelonectria olida]
MDERVRADRLDAIHLQALARALRNLLQSDLALITYAQILDGLPTSDTAWDQYGSKYDPDHPVNQHEELCPGSLEMARKFREEFDIYDLKLSAELLEEFQATVPSARAFKLRLIETAASALHQIGVLLFRLDKLHDASTTDGYDIEAVTHWERPPDEWARVVPWPTMFIQTHFAAHEQYPNGIGDMVGYWAEDRIIGGVVLFDHSESWQHDNEPNIYVQCSRANATFRVCQLLDGQQDALISFLERDDVGGVADSPLPILPGSRNRVRVDPRDAIPNHAIYRNVWERRPPQQRLRMQRFMEPCVINSLDYPEKDVDAEIERLNKM